MIRPAVPGDAGAIAVVHVTSWRAAYCGLIPDAVLDALSTSDRTARWQKILTAAGHARSSREWVIEEAGAVVGFASAGVSRDPDVPAGTAELYALYLTPAAWGRSLGRQLMTVVLDEIRAGGSERVTLWVLASNTRARRFYQAMGWAPDGAETTRPFGGVPLQEVRYALEVGR